MNINNLHVCPVYEHAFTLTTIRVVTGNLSGTDATPDRGGYNFSFVSMKPFVTRLPATNSEGKSLRY